MCSLYKLAIAAVVTGGMAAGASAATVQTTFDLAKLLGESGTTDVPVVSLVQNGIRLTLSRYDSDEGFLVDGDGVSVYGSEDSSGPISSFTLVFDHDVKLISYKYGYLFGKRDDLRLTLSGSMVPSCIAEVN